MTIEQKTSRSYRFAESTLDHIATSSKVTGQNATAVVEAAIAEYSLKWRIMRKFSKHVIQLGIANEVRELAFDIPKRPALHWDEPIGRLLRLAYRLAILMRKRNRGETTTLYLGMLDRLISDVSGFRAELVVRIENEDFYDLE